MQKGTALLEDLEVEIQDDGILHLPDEVLALRLTGLSLARTTAHVSELAP